MIMSFCSRFPWDLSAHHLRSWMRSAFIAELCMLVGVFDLLELVFDQRREEGDIDRFAVARCSAVRRDIMGVLNL